jgi:hypothetical protein
VLQVAAAELLGDLVQRGTVLGAVVRVADPDPSRIDRYQA